MWAMIPMIKMQRIIKKKNYYDILNLKKDATQDEIKREYKKQAVRFHLDKNHSKLAEECFKKISEAYQYLSDPEKKRHFMIIRGMNMNSKKNITNPIVDITRKKLSHLRLFIFFLEMDFIQAVEDTIIITMKIIQMMIYVIEEA